MRLLRHGTSPADGRTQQRPQLSQPSTMAMACCLALATPAVGAVDLNEIRPNPTGTDPSVQDVELLGTPFAAFSGVLLSIESDSGPLAGTIDRAATIAGSFDANGLLLVQVPDLENPSCTLVLVSSFSGSAGVTDIDSDDDGIVDDLSTVGSIIDAIGVPDTALGEPLYGTQLGRPGLHLQR